MAARHAMEAHPPALIEAIVRVLVPPAAREHVLGDLSERYVSPRAYLLEALRTVPFVVGSRIRRTTHPAGLLFGAALLIVGFGAGATDGFLARAALPTLVALVAVVLRDAYRVADARRPWRQALVDVAVVAAAAAVSQVVLAVVHPAWLMAGGAVGTSAAILAVMYLVRVQNPAGFVRAQPVFASTMSLEELRQEIQAAERVGRRAVRIEVVAGLCIAVSFGATALFGGGPPIVRIGSAVTAAGVLLVVRRLWRSWSESPVPADAPFDDAVARYRARLERTCQGLRTMWRWYLLPIFAGPTIMVAGGAAAGSDGLRGLVVGVALLLVLGPLLAWLWADAARAIQARSAALGSVRERDPTRSCPREVAGSRPRPRAGRA